MPNTDVEMNQGLLRGASYYPYDLLGSPVDLINMGLQPLGLGSQKPVMGSDWLQSLAQEYGLSAQPTGSNSESVARLAMSLTNPAAGARFISKGVESSPSIAARIISPLSRPQQFTESTVTTEGLPKTLSNISGDTIAEALALERYKTAASPSLQNVIQRQGYWAGESNPVFVSEGNRSFTVGGNKSLLRDVAQTAENLEQAGATSTRATALPFGDLSQGNAAFLTRNGKPLTNADVTKLNKALSESTDAVLQHRKGGEGLLFKGNWIDGVTLQDMVNIAKKEIPDLRVKPALSTPEIDRAYFERPVYQSLGALPREESVRGKLTQAFDELLKKKGYRE
jgi:hypothetical protein